MDVNEYHSYNIPARAGGSRISVYFTVHDGGAANF
jgi:hypothetical protein